MFCKKCGKQLPDGANFCFICGAPQKEDMKVEEPKWETCEIRLAEVQAGGTFKRPVMKFLASAYGERGKYNAGDSDQFRGDKAPYSGVSDIPYMHEKDMNVARSALGKLEEKLLNDGWEFMGTFGDWFWARRFRRRIK